LPEVPPLVPGGRDPRTGLDRELASVETGKWVTLGLAASPDGRTVLYTRVTPRIDLRMIETFH
jgi:hypothetical protein